MREPACGLSQQVAEVGGSRSLDAQVEVGAAPTTPGRVGTARRPGFGQRDGKVYESRNQWWNPLKRITGSNLVDMGRAAAHDRLGGRLRTRFDTGRDGGHEESLRRTRGEAAGEELGTAPVDRLLVNVRTIPGFPYPPLSQGGDGHARDRPVARGWGGVPVVVRGRESRLHGEGGQRVRMQGTGRSGG
jgi:hypothetical protein